MKPKIIATVSNNILTDQRLDKVCSTLQNSGYEVTLIGTNNRGLPKLNKSFRTQRMRLIFQKGMFFYAEMNVRFFFKLLFIKKKDALLLANDLDTLLPVYLTSKLFGNKLVFDSHEIFSELPSVRGRFSQKIWKYLERMMVPKMNYFYTVSNGYADWFEQQYGNRPVVVKNVPLKDKKQTTSNKQRTTKVIIYQGAINYSRGIDKMILAMRFLKNVELWIVGKGPALTDYQQLCEDHQLNEKVNFLGRIEPEELKKITPQADLGLSLEEDNGLSYRYALPNKIFDYIQAEIPVLATYLPEIKKLVHQYQIGETIDNHEPQHIAKKIQSMLEKGKIPFAKNLEKAADDLVWENEIENLLRVYQSAMEHK